MSGVELRRRLIQATSGHRPAEIDTVRVIESWDIMLDASDRRMVVPAHQVVTARETDNPSITAVRYADGPDRVVKVPLWRLIVRLGQIYDVDDLSQEYLLLTVAATGASVLIRRHKIDGSGYHWSESHPEAEGSTVEVRHAQAGGRAVETEVIHVREEIDVVAAQLNGSGWWDPLGASPWL